MTSWNISFTLSKDKKRGRKDSQQERAAFKTRPERPCLIRLDQFIIWIIMRYLWSLRIIEGCSTCVLLTLQPTPRRLHPKSSTKSQKQLHIGLDLLPWLNSQMARHRSYQATWASDCPKTWSPRAQSGRPRPRKLVRPPPGRSVNGRAFRDRGAVWYM